MPTDNDVRKRAAAAIEEEFELNAVVNAPLLARIAIDAIDREGLEVVDPE